MMTYEQQVMDAIRADGTLKYDTNDWWTVCHAHDMSFDVNVYSNEYDDKLGDDEFRVAYYRILQDGDTDYNDYDTVTVYKNQLLKGN